MEKRRINVRAIVWKDGKLLAVKHKDKDGTETAYWAVPGGGLDPLESLTDGLKREIMEEVGIKATIGRLALVQQFRSHRTGYDEELEFFFFVDNVDDFVDINFHDTTHGAIELARVEFIDPTQEDVLPNILQTPEFQAVARDKNAGVLYHNKL